MHERLIPILECPECRGEITIIERTGADEITEGVLGCSGCGRNYLIINGIPRMLPDALMDTVRDRHPDYFEKYNKYKFAGGSADDSWATREKRRTSRSFGYQWNVFSTMYEDWKENFLDYVLPLDGDFFKGKKGLDMGCGFGRHLYWSGTFGAEMVGVDLSEAVEAAYKNTRHLPNVQVVQGDIFNLPLKKKYFDFGYSIGVLHHLPDPRGGFSKLAEMVRPGGTVFAWVYGVRRGPLEWLSVLLRAAAHRMSLRLLHAMCVMIAVVLRIFSHYPYLALKKIPGLSRLADRLPFPLRDHARYPFSVTIADAFDRLSVPLVKYYDEPEFREWFTGEGLENIRILRRFKNNESWRGIGNVPVK